MIKFLVYLLGVMILGIGQGWLRAELGDGVAFMVVIAYLLCLRLLAEGAEKLKNKLQRPEDA